MTEVVIASAVRTAIGKFNGAYKNTRAPELGAKAITAAIERAGIEPGAVNEVAMGMVLTAGQGQNPARQAQIYAGLPYSVGAFTVNKVCGSGMKAMMLGANSIKAGQAEIIVAGGMENMTLAPYGLPKARSGFRLNDGVVKDFMVYDGLWDIYNDFHMGNTGELIAEKFDVTREDADALALRSHLNAAKATESGIFQDEIVPVEIPQRKGDPIVLDKDEGIRPDSTMESLGRLRPAFKKDGLVTAGNASQLSDGAAATVLMSAEKAQELGVKPVARIVDYNWSGLAPEWVMEAPIPGVKAIMEKNDLTMADFDLVEHNEAFASASCAVQKTFGIPDDKFNVHGGAVALGHPIGCSGTRIVTTLLNALKHNGGKRGLATICLGGGNATSMIVEML